MKTSKKITEPIKNTEKERLELVEKKVEIQKKRIEIKKEKLAMEKILGEKGREFLEIALSNSGQYDVFVAKYDTLGNVLWAKKAGGTSYDEGKGIACDANGNVYVTGYFGSASIAFGTYTLTNTSSGTGDVFIAKYDPSGNVLWAKKATGNQNDRGNAITIDADGNILITGYFNSSITFDTYTLTSNGFSDMFVAKYDPSGNVIWATSAGGADADEGFGICADTNRNVLVTGYFRNDSIIFGSDTLTNAGLRDIFIVKYDSSGSALWAKKAGGTADYDEGLDISTDATGNVFTTGRFYSASISFDTVILNKIGNQDVFVVKYNPSGNILWAKNAGGGGSSAGLAYGISTDKYGNSLITGKYSGFSFTFGTINLGGAGSWDDLFVVKYDSSGNVIWAIKVGAVDNDWGLSISTDANGNALLTGSFWSATLAFGTTTLTNTNTNGYDFYVAKLNPPNPPFAAFSMNNDTICVNGCVNFTDQSTNSPTSWAWAFQGGNPVNSTSQNPTNVCFSTAGTHTISLIATNSIGSDTAISTIVVQTCTGIQEEKNLRTVTISPNPFSSQTTLQTVVPLHNATLTVDNCFGQQVQQFVIRNSDSFVIRRDNLPSGLYFVRLTEGDKTFATDKLVITDN